MTTPLATGALKEFIRRETERILGACTQCGKCLEACPMAPYANPRYTGDPKPVVGGILALLRGESGTPEALGWASVCVRSGDCVPACPEQVNPTMMLRIARMVASGGLGGPCRIALPQDRDFFNRVRAFARLQLTEEEIRDWM
jgi:heterodisulfide reductase subunit C